MKPKNALPKGRVLENYRIERVLGGGGFSIVYLATNLDNQENVVIKEYLPQAHAVRLKDLSVRCSSEDFSSSFKLGYKRFLEEAAALAKLNHPNIVHVQNFFRCNNTVYMVMDYEYGKDLRYFIKHYNGNLTEKFIRTVFPELLLGLEELHSNELLHLDIKPANIFLRPGGKPLLLDFGATRNSSLSPEEGGPHTLTRGFAPIEQHQHKTVGPWSDLYALGASIYACMTGKAPPASPDRVKKDTLKPLALNDFDRNYSAQLVEMVDWCLELHHTDRPQSARELLTALNAKDHKSKLDNPWYKKNISLPWQKKKVQPK